jgi:hypothetical protein
MRYILPLLFIPVLAHAQDNAAMLTKAKQHVEKLCSPEFHGRGYVNGGDSIAAAYIASEFSRIGLQPVKKDFFQPFEFNVNTFPDSMRVSIDGRSLAPGKDYIVDAYSGSAKGSYEIVHLSAADLLSPEKRSMAMGVIAGKAVHVQWPATKNADTLQLIAEMERDLMHYGPVLKKVDEKLIWSVGQEALPFPLIEISSDLLTDSSTTVDLNIRSKLKVRHQARNVLGWIKGSGKGVIMITAHYDHLGRMGSDTYFPGANDNASGVAMLLALAEHFKKKAPKHNLLFVAFAGEEAGLVGSEWCAVDRAIDFANVRILINLDILGTGDDGIMVVNATEQKDAFDRLVALNGMSSYLKEVKARGPACNSDHCPFVKRGIPGIFIYTLGGIAAYHDVHDQAATLPLTEFPDLFMLLRDLIAGYR